jgi:hypothetical protein
MDSTPAQTSSAPADVPQVPSDILPWSPQHVVNGLPEQVFDDVVTVVCDAAFYPL